MTAFVLDTFIADDGADLSGHVAQVGGTWAPHAVNGAAGTFKTASERVYANGVGGNPTYISGATPPSADYWVEAYVLLRNYAADGRSAGPVARLSTTVITGYHARYANGLWELVKIVAGVTTVLASVAAAWSNGQLRTVRLEVQGSAQRLIVDGALLLTTGDSAISAAGMAGVRALTGSATGGFHIEALIADASFTPPAASPSAFALLGVA